MRDKSYYRYWRARDKYKVGRERLASGVCCKCGAHQAEHLQALKDEMDAKQSEYEAHAAKSMEGE